jgi:hypothetical protein
MVDGICFVVRLEFIHGRIMNKHKALLGAVANIGFDNSLIFFRSIIFLKRTGGNCTGCVSKVKWRIGGRPAFLIQGTYRRFSRPG